MLCNTRYIYFTILFVFVSTVQGQEEVTTGELSATLSTGKYDGGKYDGASLAGADMSPVLHAAQEGPRYGSLALPPGESCRIFPADPYINATIHRLVQGGAKLISYTIPRVGDWTPEFPLAVWGWARVSNDHGRTLLSMEYTYGLMSLMTLTIGQETLDVELEDAPPGCARDLPTPEKNLKLMTLALRDFGDSEILTVSQPEMVCHEVIVNTTGTAKFANRCCKKSDEDPTRFLCEIDQRNKYLGFLYMLLDLVRYLTLLFGPALLMEYIIKMGEGIEFIPYKVPIPEERGPLKKNIYITTSPSDVTEKDYEHKVDLRKSSGWPKFRLSQENLPRNQVVPVNITQYDILVTHYHLVTETYVPVGPFSCVYRTLFRCHLHRLGPFIECCKTRLFNNSFLTWNDVARKLGALLLILVLPWVYYARVIIFYLYENEERSQRVSVTNFYHLRYSYEHSLVAFLGPFHWSFILMYIVCFLSVVTITYLMTRQNEQCIRKIMIDSFFDYKHLYWTKIWKLFGKNLVFPLRRYRLKGFLVGIIYWPIVTPLTTLVCLLYICPTTYLIYRMIHHSIFGGLRVIPKCCKVKRYKVCRKEDKTIDFFIIENWFSKEVDDCHGNSFDEIDGKPLLSRGLSRSVSASKNATTATKYQLSAAYTSKERQMKCSKYLFAVLLCIFSTLTALLLLSECLGFLVEMAVFTMMGLIINAGRLIRYVTFVLLLLGYTYDCVNNVKNAYLRLNKYIFLALQGHLEADLNLVTSEKSEKQENTGFIINALTTSERERLPDGSVAKTEAGTQTENGGETQENSQETVGDKPASETRDAVIDVTQNNNVCVPGVDAGTCPDDVDTDSDDSDWDYLFQRRDDYDDTDGLRPSKKQLKCPTGVPAKFKNVANIKSQWNINDLVVFMDNRDVPRIPRRLFDEVCNVRSSGLPGPLHESYAAALRQLGFIIIFLLFVALSIRSFGMYYKTSIGTDLILTVISGFIPLIIGRFLNPKPPAVEARTMNFKTRLNHILSNYNEWWQMYDFPFERDYDSTTTGENIDYLILVDEELNNTAA